MSLKTASMEWKKSVTSLFMNWLQKIKLTGFEYLEFFLGVNIIWWQNDYKQISGL